MSPLIAGPPRALGRLLTMLGIFVPSMVAAAQAPVGFSRLRRLDGLSPEYIVVAGTGSYYYVAGALFGLGPSSDEPFRVDSGGIGDLAVSHAGDHLAYSKWVGDFGAIWTVRLDPMTGRPSGSPRRLSIRSGRGASFSPDGRSIAFNTIPVTDTAVPRIISVPTGGGPERVLSREAGWAANLRWSPDGRWIYYRHGITTAKGPFRTLRRVRPDGSGGETLRQIGELIGISPDGALLAFTDPGPLRTARNRVVTLANPLGNELHRFVLQGAFLPVAWGPGPRQLLLMGGGRGVSGIRYIDLSGRIRNLTPATGTDYQPRFSSDGKEIWLLTPAADGARIEALDFETGRRRVIGTMPAGEFMGLWMGLQKALVVSPDRRELRIIDLPSGRGRLLPECTGTRNLFSVREPAELLYGCRTGTSLEAKSFSIVDGTGSRLGAFLLRRDDTPLGFLGSGLVVGSGPTTSGAWRLELLSPTGRRRSLFEGREGDKLDNFSESADGAWIAALPVNSAGVATSVQLIPIRQGIARSLAMPPLVPTGAPAWDPAGRYLAVWGGREGREDIWIVPLNGDSPFPLTAGEAGSIEMPRIAPDGRGFVYESADRESSVWTVDLPAVVPGLARGRPR